MDYSQLELPPQAMEDLHRLSHQPEWISLIALLRSLDRQATESLIAFQTGDEAYERRGYARGMRKVLQTVQEIYANSHKQVNDVSTKHEFDTGRSAESIVAALNRVVEFDVRNPADKPARSPAY